MYIYIGDTEIIAYDTIVAIVEKELFHSSNKLRLLIEDHRKRNRVFGSFQDAKSIIITTDSVYYSSLATVTLKNRDELFEEMEESYGIKFE